MPHKRKTRLLLIGIDAYQYWGYLSYPVSDCKDFWDVLKIHYGFLETDLIFDPLYNEQATKSNIYDGLYSLVSDTDEQGKTLIGPDDNLIIYFAGHGYLDERIKEGYWIPFEGPDPRKVRPSEFEEKTISVSKVVPLLSNINAHHIVLIVDACFPQTFARMTLNLPSTGNPNHSEEMPSRWVLTSGRLEPVPDKSLFAEALRDLLESNAKPTISIDVLGGQIKERVPKSWCDHLTEKTVAGGEFFFHRQSSLPISDPPPQPGISAETLLWRMRQGSKQYLERLKAGRFKYLRIEKLLLTGTSLPDFVDTKVKVQEQVSPLHSAVQSLWGQAEPHAVILGDGGMGKTVSLLRLWEDWLDSAATAVPAFVALNEYNALREAERDDFVLRSIARNCGLAESLTDEWKNALWDILRQPQPDGSPSVLLLLDGFNEVTAERTPLLVELNHLAQEAQGVQMAITSRYVEIRNFQWARQSEILELQALPTDKINDYLRGLSLPLPKDEAIRQLLGNPMMLTIYAGSSQSARCHASDNRFRFLPPQSVGELLWNFTEAQLVKYYEDNDHDPDEQIWHRFLLRCLLPYFAYRMEENGDFFLAYRRRSKPDFNFQMLVDEAFIALNHTELTDIFPEFEGKRPLLGLGELSDLDAREQRARRVREYLVEKLTLLVLEKDQLRFLHQNFRDFFAACHLLNMAEMGSIAPYWTTRGLPVYLRRMLAQIEGEHYYDPQKVLMGAPIPGFQPNNRLARLLDQCRNFFHDEPTQTVVMNVVQTLVEGRGTLAGSDLRKLDLQKVYFNNISLSEHFGHFRYLSAKLDGSQLIGELFYAQGHSASIRSMCYSPDGKKILSGSEDKTVKEWSVESGKCLQTLRGHDATVHSACYSPDGKKILSGSYDQTVKEWLVESGECLQTLRGHDAQIASVCYSPDGKKILSGSEDKTVKEWSVENSKCLQTLRGHSRLVYSVCYSPDGKKILSGSYDHTAKEWSVESGECLQTLRGHDAAITSVCYSPDGEKILSGSYDQTVKEWSVESGECLQTLHEHEVFYRFRSVCYSPDGKKILSGSEFGKVQEWSVESGKCIQTLHAHARVFWFGTVCYSPDGKKILSLGTSDFTLKEWSVESGKCLQTLGGHSSIVTNVCYSPDGEKILSGSNDHTVKEWSVESGKCLQTLDGHSSIVTNVCYSPDGKKILSGSNDHTVKEWSVESGKCLQTLHEGFGQVTSVRYSPDGKKILSGSDYGKVKEWSVESGKCLQTLRGHDAEIASVCYSPDGKKILSGSYDKTVKEWSVESGKCLQTLHEHSKEINSVCYSQDGKKILSGSSDKTVKEWSVESGKCLLTLYNEVGVLVYGCDFSRCHPDSIFKAVEKERLRQYGAIFDEEDQVQWEAGMAEARSGLGKNKSKNT